MLSRLLVIYCVGLMALTANAAAPLSQVMPKGAVVYAEMNGIGQKIFQLRDSEYFKTILESPQIKEIERRDDYVKVMAGKAFLEVYLAMDLWTVADKLLSEMAVGLYMQDDGEPTPVIMLRMKDLEAWAKVRERLKPIVTLADEKVQREIKGDLEYLTMEQMHVVFHKEWALATPEKSLIDSAIAGLTGRGKGSVAENPSFKKMEKSRGAKHMLRVWGDLATFRDFAGERMGVPNKYDDGFVSLMFSGIMELAMKSDYLGLDLDVDEKGMQLTAGIEGDASRIDKKFGWFFSDAKTPGTKDVPAVKGLMGGLTIHRDIAGWYDKREILLEEDLMAGFDEFESGVGNLFPGRDIGQDIIPALGKSITLLAAEQNFDHLDGEPGIKLPGFAVIFDMNNPQDGAMFQLLFQTVVTIVNLQAVEEGNMREPSVMTAAVHNNTAINTIQFLKKPKGERLDIGYNFVPSAATVNNRFVFCSSLSLCKALIDEMKKPQDMKRSNRNFNLEFHPSVLTGLVKQNRRTLVAKSIQQGKLAEQARQEIKTVESVLDFIKLIRLNTSVEQSGFQIQLNTKWN